MNNTKPAYTPTPDEIAREAAKIKAEYLASGRCVHGDAKIGRREKKAYKVDGVKRCGRTGR